METERNLKKLLKRFYKEAPSSGPDAKKVKFSEVKDKVTDHCPQTSISTKMISSAISDEFPNTKSVKLGKQRHLYLFGMDKVQEQGSSSSSTSTSLDDSALKAALKRIEELEHQNRLLQNRVDEQEQQHRSPVSAVILDSEVGGLLRSDLSVFHGPDTIEHFDGFSVDSVLAEIRSHAPAVLELLNTMGQTNRHDDGTDLARLSQLRVMMSLSSLLKCRSIQVLGIQLLITFMLIARSTNKQAIAVLNHLGVCTSYTTAWKYLKFLTSEAHYLERIKSGHWIWVYDNLNLRQGIRHEREDCHASMMNVTSRLAVKIRHLPEFEFSWSDKTPQRSRDSITIEDILPSQDDSRVLKEHAVQFMMRFLVEAFSSLKDMNKLVPEVSPIHPVQKSEIVPMKLLFKDEKYKSETIDILTQLYSDADLTGDHQLVLGDQLTCKVIRGCKVWRSPEPDPVDKLMWANEIPGDFHFLWECLKVLFLMFWEPHGNTGSLSSMRDVINRKQVDKPVKIYNTGDEFLLHAFKAHLTASICTHLNLTSASDDIPHETTLDWLQTTAEKLVKVTLMPVTSDDPVYSMHRCFLHTAFLYIDLRNAIRHEDGPHIVRLWKLWLPRLIGTGRKNYAVECVHHIASLCADLPRHLAYIATHNRTVNMEGKPGRGKPLDQLNEHYNLVLKETMRAGGGNITSTHAEEISLCALFLMDASKKVDRDFSAHRSTAHTVRDAEKDIRRLTHTLLDSKVTSEDSGRNSPPFTDPTTIGHKKIGTTTWVKDTLQKSSSDDLEVEDSDEQLIDLNYELSDVVW